MPILKKAGLKGNYLVFSHAYLVEVLKYLIDDQEESCFLVDLEDKIDGRNQNPPNDDSVWRIVHPDMAAI